MLCGEELRGAVLDVYLHCTAAAGFFSSSLSNRDTGEGGREGM